MCSPPATACLAPEQATQWLWKLPNAVRLRLAAWTSSCAKERADGEFSNEFSGNSQPQSFLARFRATDEFGLPSVARFRRRLGRRRVEDARRSDRQRHLALCRVEHRSQQDDRHEQ